MTQQQSNPKLRTLPASSPSFSTCSECSGTGFRPTRGGVVRCNCRKKKEAPNPPSPTPIADYSIPSAAAKHQLNQCQRLVLFLRERGDKGATSVELVTILKILRYSSRIFTCRKSSYVIEAVDEGNNIWRYFLRHEPVVESPPYIFQQVGPTEQDQPKVLVGVTPSLFTEAGR